MLLIHICRQNVVSSSELQIRKHNVFARPTRYCEVPHSTIADTLLQQLIRFVLPTGYDDHCGSRSNK